MADTPPRARLRALSSHPVSPSPAVSAGFLDEPVFMFKPEEGYSACYGSRLQLEALAMIPTGIRWPSGRQTAHWMVDRWQWTLSLTDRKSRECKDLPVSNPADYWCLLWYLTRDSSDWAEVTNKKRESAHLTFLRTDEGKAYAARESRLWWQAQQDRTFARFMCHVLAFTARSKRHARNFSVQGGRHA